MGRQLDMTVDRSESTILRYFRSTGVSQPQLRAGNDVLINLRTWDRENTEAVVEGKLS